VMWLRMFRDGSCPDTGRGDRDPAGHRTELDVAGLLDHGAMSFTSGASGAGGGPGPAAAAPDAMAAR